MSKKIDVCEKDLYYLNKLYTEGVANSHSQPQSYRDLVVLKPWGYEFLAFENDKVAVWFLHIKEGHSTSMHCHPKKKTTLAVLDGEAFCTTFMTRNSVKPMQSVQIEKGVFHSTTAVSSEGIFLLELETPPNKTDLVRFNDNYGREKAGYEPTSQMIDSDLSRFNYFHFTEQDHDALAQSSASLQNFAAAGFQVGLAQLKKGDDLKAKMPLKPDEVALICRGTVVADQDRFVVSEIIDHSVMASRELWIEEDTTLLRLKRGLS